MVVAELYSGQKLVQQSNLAIMEFSLVSCHCQIQLKKCNSYLQVNEKSGFLNK